MNSPKQLHQALNHLDALPPIPYIARKILSVNLVTDEGERELLELIKADPIILSKIIGLANSPLLGTGREILTLHDAAALLGINRVKMVALSFSILYSMLHKPTGLLDIQGLWQHSLAVALTMETLARLMPKNLRPPDDEIYLAGLLHDIGFLVLDYLDSSLSNQFHARMAAEPGRPVEKIEAEMLEMSHGELGAALGRHWGLPESIIAVLNYHHIPDDVRAVVGQPLVTMVNIAEKLLPTFGIPESVRPEISSGEWQSLGIDPAKEDEIIAIAEKNIREISSMFI